MGQIMDIKISFVRTSKNLEKLSGVQESSVYSKVCNQVIHERAVTSENRSSGFPTRSDTNLAGQSLMIARDLKFRI